MGEVVSAAPVSPELLAAGLIEPDYPLQAHLGYRMLDWTDGFSRFELPLQPYLSNRYGIPHGGIYGVMLDTVMGFSGSFTGDPLVKKTAMTLSMTVQFLSRPKGSTLFAEGRRIGGGASTFFAEGRIEDDTGTLIATSSGTFRIRSAS
ncbi:PaaI family thioesterase [Xinfangfangia sp. CPCC 101601]|uniref:PaaI family thioesterase n=1 Tax=Pseudogemmobacter lacusdianii TaxID=3069608 RepID=A0ABU0W252_9RHOB|nr:PaaI family thioesterase [Xinfangfangia sp. CPCC 101601]MDQ2068101.1 PaaI family thioesterase [Xinfangfangia sp. CPCC 101601]